MTYVVTDACIKCKYMDCVEVCPVDCFYEGENMLVINPSECIDCGVCEPECPAEAILPDTESGLEQWLELNTKFSAEWPNITAEEGPARRRRRAQGRGRQVRASTSRPSPAKATEPAACGRPIRARTAPSARCDASGVEILLRKCYIIQQRAARFSGGRASHQERQDPTGNRFEALQFGRAHRRAVAGEL